MQLFVTNKKLNEKMNAEKRMLTVEIEHSGHVKDCKEYRESAKEELFEIKENMRINREETDKNFDEIKRAQDDRHKQNSITLRWQVRMLIAIILSILGFIGMQAWDRVFPKADVHSSSQI